MPTSDERDYGTKRPPFKPLEGFLIGFLLALVIALAILLTNAPDIDSTPPVDNEMSTVQSIKCYPKHNKVEAPSLSACFTK